MAASPGLEPRLTESESAVLPLDDEAIFFRGLLKHFFWIVKHFCSYSLHFFLIYPKLSLSKAAKRGKYGTKIIF